jgi:hypothetical protein
MGPGQPQPQGQTVPQAPPQGVPQDQTAPQSAPQAAPQGAGLAFSPVPVPNPPLVVPAPQSPVQRGGVSRIPQVIPLVPPPPTVAPPSIPRVGPIIEVARDAASRGPLGGGGYTSGSYVAPAPGPGEYTFSGSNGDIINGRLMPDQAAFNELGRRAADEANGPAIRVISGVGGALGEGVDAGEAAAANAAGWLGGVGRRIVSFFG